MIVDPDFLDHWKTRLLIGSLDGDLCAPLYVLRLWAHCQNRRQSEFDNLSPEALKALCCFPGQANKLESSLVASGFVRRDAGVLIVLGWSEYNSKLIANWENGGKGGRPPKITQQKPNDNPTITQNGFGLTQQEPIGVDRIGEDKTRVKTPKPPSRASVYSDFFERWWKAYPAIRQCNKQTAYKRYKAAGKALVANGRTREEAVVFLQERCEAFAKSPLGQCRYCPAADVWLNKGRYDDNPVAWERGESAAQREDSTITEADLL